MLKPSGEQSSNNISIQSEIKQWGNSLGIRIPREIRDNMNFSDGSRVRISMSRKTKKIIIENFGEDQKKLFDLSKNLKLSDLTKKITKKNRPSKDRIALSVIGKEVW